MKIKIKDKGFTLIETIIVVSIFSILMISISIVFISLYKTQGNDIDLIKRTRNADRAIEIMSREIREANRGENGAFCLETVQGQELTFYSDIDEDGETEKITYELQGNDLLKKVVEPGEDSSYSGSEAESVVCEGVYNEENVIFSYYNQTYTGIEEAMSDPVNNVSVKTIGIDLYVNIEGSNLQEPFYINTKVQVRNLK